MLFAVFYFFFLNFFFVREQVHGKVKWALRWLRDEWVERQPGKIENLFERGSGQRRDASPKKLKSEFEWERHRRTATEWVAFSVWLIFFWGGRGSLVGRRIYYGDLLLFLCQTNQLSSSVLASTSAPAPPSLLISSCRKIPLQVEWNTLVGLICRFLCRSAAISW